MGQYHSIYNRTKKETIRIGGAKLWEQAHAATAAALLLLLSNSNGRGGGDFTTYPKDYKKLTAQEKRDKAAIEAAQGRWAGDSIVVQGDYAQDSDKGFIEKENLEDFTDITGIVAAALLIADNGDESEILKIIESEVGTSFGSVKALNVVKTKGLDRNNQKVALYKA